ncbi:sulfur carrier protein ThiS [bacterium]|nr:sulfur carrier protein ThiS [bacterium]
MHITLNGDAREFPLDTTVNELLEALGYAGKRVAVERNGEIVPKSQHAQTAQPLAFGQITHCQPPRGADALRTL